jgi:hypothetical protein
MTINRRKPIPEDFRIPTNFDFAAFKQEEALWQNKSKWHRRISFAMIHIFINLIIAFAYYLNEKSIYNFTDFSIRKYGATLYLTIVLTTAFIPVAAIFYLIYDKIYDKFLSTKIVPKNIKNYLPLVEAYRQATADWEYLNLETGEGFWKALRGEKFEDALARLFRRRGMSVEKTKKTGDGGVDLILRSGSEVIFVQCKGYSKPVPVAPIREIAGVCSRSRSKPVVAAVNGFTKGAKECARELNVTLIDTPGIVRMAALDSLDVSKM